MMQLLLALPRETREHHYPPVMPVFSELSNDWGDMSAGSRGGSSRAVFTQEFGQIYKGGREPTPTLPKPQRRPGAAALSSWRTPPRFPHRVLQPMPRTGRDRALLLCSHQQPQPGSSPALPPRLCSGEIRSFPQSHNFAGSPSFSLPAGFLLQTPRVSCSRWGRGGTPVLGASQAKLCLQRGGGGGGGWALSPQRLPGSMSCPGQTPSPSLDGNEGANSGVPGEEGEI